jgi:hypothetical protein
MKSYYQHITMKITDGPEYRRIEEMPDFVPLTVKAVLTNKDGLPLHKGRVYCMLPAKDPRYVLAKGFEYTADITVDGDKVFLTKIHPPAGGY